MCFSNLAPLEKRKSRRVKLFSQRLHSRIRIGDRVLFHPKHLHHLIPQMVDHLHCDSPRRRFVEGAAGVAVEGLPGVFVDLGLQSRLP